MTVTLTPWSPAGELIARLETAAAWRRTCRAVVRVLVDDALTDEDAPDDLPFYQWTPGPYRRGLPDATWEVTIRGRISASTPAGACEMPFIVAWSGTRRAAVLCVGP